MGFGRTLATSSLGQPLDFSARVFVDADETLARECVSAEVMAGEARVSPASVRVRLEPTRDAGQRNVRVTTTTFIDEPIVTVNLSMGCTSQVTRRFVAFIDPPGIGLPESPPAELADMRAAGADSPLEDVARRADARRAPAARTRPTSGERRVARPGTRGHRAVNVASATAPRPVVASARAAPGRAPAAPPPASPGGPRLELDAPRVVAAATIASAAANAMPAAVAPPAMPAASAAESPPLALDARPAALPDAATAEALARERDRIRVLESGLAQLLSQSQATQKSMGVLQARLREAEESRYTNVFVYVLAGLVVFFALLAAAFWAVRPRQRRRAGWLDAAAKQARAQRDAAPAAGPPSQHGSAAVGGAPASPPSGWKTSTAHGFLQQTAPASIGGLEVTTVLGPSASAAAVAGAAAAARRSDSLPMEELIDLEQQAEFFVVLGQDEAAIDLLATYLRNETVISPLPYLQLLEIHQRRGDQAAFERVREAYHERFGAAAPAWNSSLHAGRSLEGYASTVARLQAMWTTPMHAMRALDGLLFRRGEGGEAFDFPAYRDLLFLYSVARELAGQVETDFGSIDLFLPLDDPANDPGPMVVPTISHAIDLDVSTWGNEIEADDLVVRRSAGGKS